MRVARAWTGLAALLLVLSACTDEEPPAEPQPLPPIEEEPPSLPLGASVTVVLPSGEEMDPSMQEALARDVDLLEEWADERIREVRAVIADGPAFVADLTELSAERGADLVCVLGDAGPAVVERLDARYGDVELCAVHPVPLPGPAGEQPDDATPDEDDRPGTIQVHAEQLGHLVGVAARASVGSAPVGVVMDGDQLLDEWMRAGVLAGAGSGPIIEAEMADEASMAERVSNVIGEGAQVVVIDGAVGAAQAVQIATAAGVDILAPTAVVEGALLDDGVVLSWWVRWDLVLRTPVLALVGDEPQVAPLGVADEIFALTFGTAAAPGLPALLETTVDELASGERDPFTAVPAETDPASEDSDDGEDGDGEDGAQDDAQTGAPGADVDTPPSIFLSSFSRLTGHF